MRPRPQIAGNWAYSNCSLSARKIILLYIQISELANKYRPNSTCMHQGFVADKKHSKYAHNLIACIGLSVTKTWKLLCLNNKTFLEGIRNVGKLSNCPVCLQSCRIIGSSDRCHLGPLTAKATALAQLSNQTASEGSRHEDVEEEVWSVVQVENKIKHV